MALTRIDKSTPAEGVICSDDLLDMQSTQPSRLEPALPDQAPLMKGQFRFAHHSGGLSIHAGAVEELTDATNTFQLPAGISFNVLWRGRVNFSVGGRRYQLGAHPEWKAEVTATVVPEGELMSRHMSEGMAVTKANVFVERNWLEAHCHQSQPRQELAELMSNGVRVMQWQPSAALEAVAQQFLMAKPPASLVETLSAERQTIELLTLCLGELLQQQEVVSGVQESCSDVTETAEAEPQSLRERIDACMEQGPADLKHLAACLGVSVSTLQRRFKMAYGQTVVDYVRQQRLQQAKVALAVGQVSIGEAAYMAGYNHSSNFVAAFKKRFNVTPSQLLEAHRHKVAGGANA